MDRSENCYVGVSATNGRIKSDTFEQQLLFAVLLEFRYSGFHHRLAELCFLSNVQILSCQTCLLGHGAILAPSEYEELSMLLLLDES